MKKTAVIKKVPIGDNKGFYIRNEKDSNKQLATLGMFLYLEVNSLLAYEFFTEWLKKEYFRPDDCAIGNGYGLSQENGMILVHSALPDDPDPHEDKTYVFTTTKEYLLELIDDWLRTTLRKPGLLNVLIEQDEQGKVTFTWLGETKNEEHANQV